jgi:hypothetical protein
MTETTSFDCLFERFYRRVEKDEEFFNYYNIGITEALQLAHERAKGCLIDALDILSSISNLQVDFSDYDEEVERLKFKTTNKENKLIADLMFQVYMERDLPLLHAFKINFTPSDLSVFSPANERNSYDTFVARLAENNKIALDDYKNRDRKTGKLKKTINYSAYGDV